MWTSGIILLETVTILAYPTALIYGNELGFDMILPIAIIKAIHEVCPCY